MRQSPALADLPPASDAAAVRAGIPLRLPRLPLPDAVALFAALSRQPLGAERFAEAVLGLAAGPAAAPRRPAAPALYRRLVERARAGDDAWVADLHRLAAALHGQGQGPQAVALARQAALDLRQRRGGEDALALRADNGLACLLQAEGLMDEARRLYLRTIEVQRRVLGHEHLDTVTTLENLATLLYEQGELRAAEPLLHEAVVLRRRLLGDAHADTLRSFNNLALLLQRQGRLAQAEPLLRQTLASQQQLFGELDPEALTSLGNLAVLVEEQGKLADAEALHRQSLALRRRRHGEAHVDTLAAVNNLCAFLLAQRRPAEAQPLLTAALPRAHALFPAGHFFPALLRARLGACLIAAGAYAAAEAQLLPAYGALQAALGGTHPRTQAACGYLVQLYDAWGQRARAASFRAQAARSS